MTDVNVPAVEIACCFDRNYIQPTAVMATSIAAHASADRRYILHLVYDGEDDAPLQIVEGFHGTALDVRLVRARNLFADIPTAYPGMPPVSFLRLALPDLLPGVERVLSLDPDTLCLKDVAEVFDTQLGSFALAAVPDLSLAAKLAAEEASGQADTGRSNTLYLERRLGLDRPARARYFNAGVLLLDLARLRTERLTTRALQFLQGPALRWSEQCVLNAFYARDYRPLPERWNTMLHPAHLQEYAPGGIALMQRVAEALSSPAILHFNWTAKPWITEPTRTAWASTWWAYAFATRLPWRVRLGPPLSRRQVLRNLANPAVHSLARRTRAVVWDRPSPGRSRGHAVANAAQHPGRAGAGAGATGPHG